MAINSTESTTTVEFVLRGEPGRVVIRYGVNEDPSRWGYPLLGLDSLVEGSRGFPVIQGEVETGAEGYGGVLSWIQVVRIKELDAEHPKEEIIYDRAPQLLEVDIPYMSFGIRPVLFDAPSIDASNVDWDAASFLTYTPDGLMTKVVRRLCGFTWGYRLRQRAPTSLPVRVTGAREWSEARSLLQS